MDRMGWGSTGYYKPLFSILFNPEMSNKTYCLIGKPSYKEHKEAMDITQS